MRQHTCSHHSHHHVHSHDLEREVGLYGIATIATLTVLIAQFAAAYWYGNIALMGDTIHVASDLSVHVSSLVIAVILLRGLVFSYSEDDLRRGFAWFGIALLIFGAFHTGYEAYTHFLDPKDSANWIVFSIAFAGGVGNLIVHTMLHRVPVNLRTITHQILHAHVFADLLMSIAVVVSVYIRIMYADEWSWSIYADPVAASVVALYMAGLAIWLSVKVSRGDYVHH